MTQQEIIDLIDKHKETYYRQQFKKGKSEAYKAHQSICFLCLCKLKKEILIKKKAINDDGNLDK